MVLKGVEIYFLETLSINWTKTRKSCLKKLCKVFQRKLIHPMRRPGFSNSYLVMGDRIRWTGSELFPLAQLSKKLVTNLWWMVSKSMFPMTELGLLPQKDHSFDVFKQGNRLQSSTQDILLKSFVGTDSLLENRLQFSKCGIINIIVSLVVSS